jgi:hypothetical protein
VRAAGEEAARFAEFVAGAGATALLVALSTEEYTSRIIAANEHLDPFRLHEDIQYFLGLFVADAGRALSVRPGFFVVGLSEFDAADLGLFVHQLSSFLQGLFGGNGKQGSSAGPRVVKTAAWPTDGDDIRILAASLGS